MSFFHSNVNRALLSECEAFGTRQMLEFNFVKKILKTFSIFQQQPAGVYEEFSSYMPAGFCCNIEDVSRIFLMQK